MKKTYYKIDVNDQWWICTKEDFLSSIIEWLKDYETLTITTTEMTEKQFNKLEEFEG